MPTYIGTLLGAAAVTLGSDLAPADQNKVKAFYVHRFTGDHTPRWAATQVSASGAKYKLQFADDADWLANTFFAINKAGRLSPRISHCESHPTWPGGVPEFITTNK